MRDESLGRMPFFVYNSMFMIWFFLWVGSLQAVQDSPERGRMRTVLAELKALPPTDYFSQIDKYRTTLEGYIERKRRVCNGDFSTMVLEEGKGIGGEGAKKLSSLERTLCFSELRSFQANFINSMHTARKKYLNHLHQLRLRQLEESRKVLLKELRQKLTP